MGEKEDMIEMFLIGLLSGVVISYFFGEPEDFYYHYKEHKYLYDKD